jgi:hypothetical protein
MADSLKAVFLFAWWLTRSYPSLAVAACGCIGACRIVHEMHRIGITTDRLFAIGLSICREEDNVHYRFVIAIAGDNTDTARSMT